MSISLSRQSSGGSEALVDKIKVCVRIRPLLRSETELTENEAQIAWKWSDQHIMQDKFQTAAQTAAAQTAGANTRDNNLAAYSFDNLFGPEASNEVIYKTVVKGLVIKTMQGYHGSVLSYGQTSSGKTFTMNGDEENIGVIPQAIKDCFEYMESCTGREFSLRVSYLEVYNEQVRDLLNVENTSIKIQNDGNKVILSGVREVIVNSTHEVAALLHEGEAYRHVGATDMNEKSSRAHTIFRLIIESTDSESTRTSTLSLVDLAGSENAKMTNSIGERAREARHINQSLLTLSTIIQRLSDKAMSESRDESRRISFDADSYSEPGSDGVSSGSNRPMQHLPYRDSKLTRIMQPSLSDNALVVIICTISPTVRCADESHNTLKFAQRAKRIKTSARINEVIDDKTLLRAYRAEIELLRAKLSSVASEATADGRPGWQRTLRINYATADDAGATVSSVLAEQPVANTDNTFPSSSSTAVLVNSYQFTEADMAEEERDIVNANKNVDLLENIALSLVRQSSSSQVPPQAMPFKESLVVLPRNNSFSSSASLNSIGSERENKIMNVEGRNGLKERRASCIKQPSTSTSRSSTPGRRSLTPTPMATASTTPTSSSRPLTPSSLRGSRAQSQASTAKTAQSDAHCKKINSLAKQLREYLARADMRNKKRIMGAGVRELKSSTKLEDPPSMDRLTLNRSNDSLESDESASTLQEVSLGSMQDDKLSVRQSFPSSSAQESASMRRLLLDMRLMGADNRFLQDELEKRDRMLSRLTEGLREVEVVQTDYQLENIRLRDALEKLQAEMEAFNLDNQNVAELRLDREIALQENRRLLAENGRLTKYVRDLDRMLTSVGIPGDDYMSSKGISMNSTLSVVPSKEHSGQTMLSMLSQGGLRGVVDAVVASSSSGNATVLTS